MPAPHGLLTSGYKYCLGVWKELRVQPIPETATALESMDPILGESNDALLNQLQASGDRVSAVVPDCIGFSLARLDEGLMFTLVATDADIAALDAVPYLDDGPCLNAVPHEETFEPTPDEGALDEGRWRLFAASASRPGIQSTLTIPIRSGERVGGSVHLYARSADAFDGHYDELAGLFDAWAPGAVTNADLSFDTRRVAQQAPRILDDKCRVEAAVGIMAAGLGLEEAVARQRLNHAAVLAGISDVTFARSVISMLGSSSDVA